MKILFTASECVPFCKTGGLADVVGSLAPALAEQGHDVRVIIPKYGMIPEEYEHKMVHTADFEVSLGWRRQYCGIEQLEKGGVTYYFLDNRYYFGRNYIYGVGGDEHERFAFFCRGVLNALPLIPFSPDIIHAHDWQTGMIPALLRIQYAGLPRYDHIKSVFTIHNLQYQGIFGVKDVQDMLGLPPEVFTDDKLEYFGNVNFLKAGVVYADEVTTVSPSYAEEIQTAYYGERLDGLLRARRNHLTGILNGLDVREFDPAQDKRIARTYTADDLSGKRACKQALQEELGLQQREDVPIIALIGRLNSQKGLDLVDYVIADIMREDIQLVCLGLGESRYVNLFSWAEQNYPGRVAARFVMDNNLAHRIYAGADIFLMPSAFEPCGLSQMIALRYGTVPVVRETGGLRDTVLSYNEFTGEGNGFTFFNYNAHDMLHVIQRALHFYHDQKEVWAKLQHRGMTADFSWLHSSGRYLELYRKLLPALITEGTPPGPAPQKPPAPQAKEETEKPVDEVKKPAPRAKKATAATETVKKPAARAKKVAPAKPAADKPAQAPAKAPGKPAARPRKPKAE
ncbi:MAG: glycogen synthase GlgA [Clostridiales bacterium]|nr:glycogen synthase GlgA [Clostridiales bacterium]